MRQEMWKSFWMKAAVFLLGMLLLPAAVWYGTMTAVAYTDGWYGQTEPSFPESTVCRAAAYTQVMDLTWGLDSNAPAVDREDLASDAVEFLRDYQAAYPSNLRLAFYPTYGDGGAPLYDDHEEGDAYIRDFWYNGWTLRLYYHPQAGATDSFYWAQRYYERTTAGCASAPYLTALCVLGLLVVGIYLARASGRKPGREEVIPGWQEKLPLDLYLVLNFTAVGCVAAGLVDMIQDSDLLFCDPLALGLWAAGLALMAALVQGGWMTVCVRGKLGKWWKNTLTYRFLRLLWRGLRAIWRGTVAAVRAIPLVWRTLLGSTGLAFLIAILLGNHAGGAYTVLSLLLILAASAFAYQLQKLRKGGQALAAGDLGYKVDTRRMIWDLRRHGEDLNAIGRGMRIAVEDQLKSERLKTELITNVSHDIKTPLTSIINYVDLLQKDHTPAQEHAYLLVLDRQARKLKKLTEDLVELSKAASGNLPCRPSRRNVRELIDQAVGEYSERLAEAGLTPVVTVPEEELTCHADGALMWRVLDNLLSNACKYAQTGTRLYVDVRREGDFACFSFKNVSRDPLNIPAEELMERFVRGDSARSSEGSGLGLNIAGSLVELQGGEFRLFVDGDLFKAEFTVPLVGPAEEPAVQAPAPQNA